MNSDAFCLLKAKVGDIGESRKSKLDFESPGEMIGQAYYSPVAATDTGFFSFFLSEHLILLIAVRF